MYRWGKKVTNYSKYGEETELRETKRKRDMKTMDEAMEPSTVTLPSELTIMKVNLLSSVVSSLPSKDTAML